MTHLPPEVPSVLLSALKVTVLFCAAWVALGLLRRGSPGTRHRIASLALAGGLLVPALAAVVPAWGVLPRPGTLAVEGRAPEPTPSDGWSRSAAPREDVPPAVDAGGNPGHAAAVGTMDRDALPWRPGLIAASIWAAVALGLLAFLALQVASTSRFVRRAQAVEDPRWTARLDELRRGLGIGRAVSLRLAGPGEMPFTWGVRRPVVVLPAEARSWSDGRARAVLGHELAHAARWDVPLIVLARVTCALHWFNPLCWMLHRRQRSDGEHACDRLALALGFRPADYAEHLLETAVAARKTQAIAPVMAARSQLEGRIMTILESESRTLRRPATAAPLLLGLALLLPVASAGWSSPADPREVSPAGAQSDTAAFRQRLQELNVDPADLQSVRAYLYDRSALTRAACVWALGTNGDPRAVEPLVAALVDPDPTVRQWAARGFLVRREGDERAVQPLAMAAGDRDGQVREWVVRAIPHLAGEHAAGTIEARLGDELAEVRQWAVRALPTTHREVAPELIRPRLQDPDAEVREWTVRALGHVGAGGLGVDLIERLEDESRDVREWAVRTLGSVGDAAAVAPLIERTLDPDAEIREWAVRSLGEIGDPRLVAPLIHRCTDPEPEVREWAVRVLGDHGDPAAVGALELRLEDGDEEVREWARRAVEELRGDRE